MIEGNEKLLSFLFPILLFHGPREEKEAKHIIYQLDYMQLLNDYLTTQNNDDHTSAAIQLGIANEILSYLQQH